MSDEIIWRYMSLAKYIELLRTQAIYFPKASLFDDKTEGKWVLHSFLIEDKTRFNLMKKNRETLIRMLQRSGNDEVELYNNVIKLLNRGNLNILLKEILESFKFYYIHNRNKFKGKEYLESLVKGWSKQFNEYPKRKEKLISQSIIHRESTYISCWYCATEMSLAMWQLFGGGKESIAIRTTIDKLKHLLELNYDSLSSKGYESDVSKVVYFSSLKDPDEKTREKIMDILTKDKDTNVGQFSIKPKEYEYEREVRGIIYPKRDIYDKLVDPDPNINGFTLPIVTDISEFICEVHIHPLENKNSIIYKVIKEVNKRFDIEKIPIKKNTIEAFAEDVDI